MKIIDFHTHILPGADHGSDGAETSEFQLEQIEKSGVSTVVVTPHFYPHANSFEHFMQRRKASIKLMSELLGERKINVFIGAEVLACEGIEKFPYLNELCIFGTKTILIEMPNENWTQSLLNSVSEIEYEGYSVVLAHIDRYKKSLAEKAIETGFRVQLNAEGINTFFKYRRLLSYFNKGSVVALGSDLHMRGDYMRFMNAVNKNPEFSESVFEKTESLLEGATDIRNCFI